MKIPNYQEVMLPLLRFLGDGQERPLREAVEAISDQFHLTDEDRQRLLPSGTSTVIGSRVGWARTYMKKAGLLESTKRGYIRVTERGMDMLRQNPKKIDVSTLERFPEFLRFRALRRDQGPVTTTAALEATPEDAIERAYGELRASVESDLLDQVKAASPAFFERVVLDLLVKMGYGGDEQNARKNINSRDGGIDGIINEDRLGLDLICIQAKRWQEPVGRPRIQEFAGALQGHRAKKGVFITTSNFTKEADAFAAGIADPKVVLIDGATLAGLMVDYKVGVSRIRSYELLKIDTDYFAEE